MNKFYISNLGTFDADLDCFRNFVDLDNANFNFVTETELVILMMLCSKIIVRNLFCKTDQEEDGTKCYWNFSQQLFHFLKLTKSF